MLKIPDAYSSAGMTKARPSDVETDSSRLNDIAAQFTSDDDINKRADEAVSNDIPNAGASIEDVSQIVSKVDTSWLPFAAKTYKISPNLDNYVIVNIPICPSDIPNRNGVAFPLAELIAYQPPPISRMVYKAWTGCPVHLEHDNEDHEKAIGVIFDTSLRVMRGFGGDKHYVVYGLIGIDKTKDPDTAAKFLNGSINTGSMGALADYFTCSVCGHRASDKPMMNCSHIRSTKEVNWRVLNHNGEDTLAYLNAHVLSPIEFSIVADPAWATCLSEMILDRGA